MNLNVEGKPVSQVDKFVYLGHQVEESGRCNGGIRRRIEIARSVFNIKKGEVGNEKTNFEVLCIWSSLLNGSEKWTLIKETIDRLEAFEMWTLLRRMLKISWKSKISNERVLLMAKTRREIIRIVKVRKLSYFGHIVRQDSLQKDIL